MRNLGIMAALLLAAALLAGSSPDAGEEKFEPVKKSNVTWHYMLNLEFMPGKYEEAVKLIHEQFIPASVEAGIEPGQYLMCATGEWDMTLIFPLPHGPAELEWEISPDDARWMNALAARLGGREKLEKMMKKFMMMIDRGEGTLLWQRKPPKAE
jgi:hypothetical protein